MRKINLLFIILCILPLVNATGINILNSTNTTISKTFGVDYLSSITIQNTESYSLYNISFDNENIIRKVVINELTSGSTATLNYTIFTNDSFSGVIRIKGFYISNIGSSNKTHNINADFSSGLSKCDFSIIKGDKVFFNNLVDDEIKLKNEATGEYVTTILDNNNYTMNFDNPMSFKYSFYRRGFRFTDICIITVLPDTGLVNDPQLDAKFNLSITNSYEPTTINLSVIDKNFTMNFLDQTDGVIIIKNTGSKIAKNVNIFGDWLSFSKNNFDLAVGEQKVVVFTIKPIVYNTSQTGRTHNKNIIVNGNFQSVNDSISVYINHAEIDNGNLNITNTTTLIDILCAARPDLCNPTPRIIYRDMSNNSDNKFNVTFGEQQIKELFAFMFENQDFQKVAYNYFKSSQQNTSDAITNINSKVVNLDNKFEQDKLERLKDNGNLNFGIIIFFFIVLIGLLIVITFMALKIKKSRALDRMI